MDLEPYRAELRAHCYRMLGSFHDAEDLVQETFLRAWKNADSFEERSSVRTWLYRIATNACLDARRSRTRRILPDSLDPGTPDAEIAWLTPFPQPEDAAEHRETIELAFLAAIQHLPPRQRATLILRDVAGWSAAETADMLDVSVASANSALQRARGTLRERLPQRRAEWAAATAPTEDERAVLRRYMDAMERADLSALAELLAADVKAVMPPIHTWFAGRDAIVAALRETWDPASPDYVGRFRALPVAANAQPAMAFYHRVGADGDFLAFGIGLLRIEDGLIVDLAAFHDPDLFPAFGLPMSLPAGGRLPQDQDHGGT